MVDRHLVTMLSIAAIMSTALVSLLFHEDVDESVEVLREDWNLPSEAGALLIPSQEGRYAYTLAIVVRRPVLELVLGFALLRNRSLPQDLGDADTPLIQTLSELGDIGDYLKMMISRSGTTQMKIGEYEARTLIEEQEHTVKVYDLTESVLALAPEREVRNLACIQGFLLNEEQRLVGHFAGGPDFFIARDPMVDLTIQRNQDVTKYSQRPSNATGTVDMDSAPPYGVLGFRDLKRDDRISITIAFNPAQVPGREALMQVVTVKVDGALQEVYVHLLRRSSAG